TSTSSAATRSRISSSLPRPTNVRGSGWFRRWTIVSTMRWPADFTRAEISATAGARETRRTSKERRRRRPRHKAFQWKGRGGGHRTRLETQDELTLNKVDYTLREPAGTPSLREVEDGTSRDPPVAMPQRRMDQTETCSITPRSRGEVCVAINPSPTRELTPRAADRYRRDGRRIRNAKIAEGPAPPWAK